MEAHRDRLASSVSGSAAFEPAGPLVPSTEPPVAVVVDVPLEDQLARAVLEARTLADAFNRLAPHLPPQLAQRARRMAAAMHDAVTTLFGGVS
jgi:hypothetical protein